MGFLAPSRVLESANRTIEQMHVEPPLPDMPIENLSGGNQQKVIVGRWLAADPKILIFDEPTQGVDVGTKAQIYKLIVDLASEGRGVILISSEFSEVANLADRVLIFREGRLIRELPGNQVTENRLFHECSQKDWL
jgi:ABC-type sugar transport system ATPase subunit